MRRGLVPILLLCILKYGHVVDSYPNSVPESPDVCSKMIPGHGPRPQQTPAPFRIALDKDEVKGGNKLEINIIGKKGATFKGFYIQVRDEDGKPIGTFLSPDENESGTHNCFKLKDNAIHHKNNNDKKSITVYWRAPEKYEGHVKVIATVLKDFETYWTNVHAKELVSVSTNNVSKIFFTSSDLPEKETEGSQEASKTSRILNYNPYSPISQLLPWDTNIDRNDPPSESLQSEPSEKSDTGEFRERQLFGPASFDFHGGLYSPKFSSLNTKGIHPNTIGYPPEASQIPPPPQDPYLYPPHHNHHHYAPNDPGTYSTPPKSILDKLETPTRDEIKQRKPKNIFPINSHHSPVGSPYAHYPPHHFADIHKNPPPPPPLKFEDPSIQHINGLPHMSQAVYDKGGHYLINHHYLSSPQHKPQGAHQFYPLNPHHHHHLPHLHQQPHYIPLQKPTDPSYPNSGYFPKDILTKLTSYIPNIYNALANNPLFNFNIDNTIESIWKPSKGVPFKQGQGHGAASVLTPTKVDMPKYGYLVYNPVRGDPFFVIPAANEEEFVANHLVKREGTLPHA